MVGDALCFYRSETEKDVDRSRLEEEKVVEAVTPGRRKEG